MANSILSVLIYVYRVQCSVVVHREHAQNRKQIINRLTTRENCLWKTAVNFLYFVTIIETL